MSDRHLKTPSVWTIAAIMFGGLFGTYTIPFQIGVMQVHMALSAVNAGLLGAVELGSISAGSILGGRLLHRTGVRSLAVTGVLMFVAADLLAIWCQGMAVLLPDRVVAGLGHGLMLAASSAAASRLDRSGQAFGKVLTICSVMFAAVLVGIPLAGINGTLQSYFGALAVLGAVLLPVALFLPREDGPAPVLPAAGVAVLPSMFARWKGALVLLAAVTLVGVPLGGIWSFAEQMGIQVGLQGEEIGMLLSVSTLTGMAGATLTAYLIRRGALGAALITAPILAAISCFGVAQAGSMAAYILAIILYNVAYMMYIATGLASAARLDPSGALAATTNGWVLACYALGTYLFGFFISFLSIQAAGLAGVALCLLAVGVATLFLRRYLPAPAAT